MGLKRLLAACGCTTVGGSAMVGKKVRAAGGLELSSHARRGSLLPNGRPLCINGEAGGTQAS